MKNNRILTNSLFLFLFSFCNCIYVLGQTAKSSGNPSTPSAGAASFAKFGDIPVDLHTGVPNISIPIYTLTEGPLNHPISINYHSSGNKVSDIASPIGLGWHLNAGGVISRIVYGIADDDDDGYLELGNSITIPSSIVQDVAEHNKDASPDIFHFSMGGYSGKFVFDKDSIIQSIPKSDFRFEFFTKDCGIILGFKLTSPDGIIFYFGYDPEDLSSLEECNDDDEYFRSSSLVNINDWFLERIVSPDGRNSIDFEYTTTDYRYDQLTPCAVLSYDDSGQQDDDHCTGSTFDTEVRTKIISEISTSTTLISFDTIERQDLYESQYNYFWDPETEYLPLGIDEINIEEGNDFEMKYVLYQSYFSDPEQTDEMGKRLRLDSLQLISVSEGNLSEPPYKFDYYFSSGFFPNYMSKQIDHWGYYNGAVDNDVLDNLIPSTTVIDEQETSISFGSADRDTDEDKMLFGMLERITYPTHGYTEFEFEANDHWKPTGSIQTPILINTCVTDCEDEQEADDEITITADMLANGTWELCITVIDDDEEITGLDPNDNDATFEVWDENETELLWSTSFNSTYNECIEDGLEDIIWLEMGVGAQTLEAGTTYVFKITSLNARVDLAVQYYDLSSGFNEDVGGLRVKKITTHDNISASNDIIRNFTYRDSTETTHSSGKLYNQPQYGFNLDGEHILFKSYSLLPLSGFEGYHIGYERVVVDHNGNGEQEHIFYDESIIDLYDSYPIPPDRARVIEGNSKEQYTYEESGIELQSQKVERQPDYYTNTAGIKYIAEDLSGFDNNGNLNEYPHTVYYIRTSLYRPGSTENVLDGVKQVSDFGYNITSEHLAPETVTTMNSDGKEIVNATKYTINYDLDSEIQDSLQARNMIIIPYQSFYIVEGDTLDGSRTTFDLYDASGVRGGSTNPDPYPYFTERWERTWTSGVLQQGAWEKQSTIDAYTSDGLVKEVTKENWETQSYTYSNKLMTSTTFDGFVTSYSYHTGSKLLEEKTNVDGSTMTYDYDGLMRITSVTDDCNDAETLTEYSYSENPNTKNFVKTTQIYPQDTSGNSEVDTIETLVYIDGLNRTIETSRKKQHHNGVFDLVLAQEYDNQGRIVKKYEAQEYFGDGGFFTINPSWNHTLIEYEDSPLNRTVSTTPPDWYATEMEYGFNTVSDTVYIDGTEEIYGDSLLYKKTTIDGNENKSIVFTDKKGRTILQRRANSSGTEKNDTYSIYDDKDRIRMVVPPGADTTNADLIYTYEYDGADNLLKKKVPDKEKILYKYNDRDLLSLQQDGNLENQSKWYAYSYDDHGRELASGFYTESLPSEPFSGVEPSDTLTLNIYGTSAFEKNKIKTEKTCILDTSDWLETEYEYDDCSRVVKTISNNQLLLSSKKDTTFSNYDGAGNVVKTIYSHRTEIDTILITERNELDVVGRLDKHFIAIDTFTEQELSSFDYNEEEQLITKKLGKTSSGYLQQLDYTYKPNNLLRKINESGLSGGDVFFMQLNYDTAYAGTSPSLRKNGDIINTIWKNISENERIYSYGYDYLDRLTAGDYLEKTGGGSPVNQDDYNTAYGYDERGNITTLSRKGMYGDPGDLQKSNIDSLAYTYYSETNQLKNIAEDQSGEASEEGYYKANGNDYDYDDNGNLVTDPQKNLEIKYNHLDLVDTIKFSDEQRLEFVYDGGGSLVRRLTYIQDTLKVEQHDYIGGMEYTNGSLESIYHAEGRAYHLGHHPDTLYVRDSINGVHQYRAKVIVSDAHLYEIDSTFVTFSVDSSVLILPEFQIDSSAEFLAHIDTFDGSGWQFEYVIADHLGNTRLVFSDLDDDESIDSSEILQRLHYYPFGLRQKGSWTFEQTSNISYQYNGIEYLDQFGLDVNLADFRALDPAVGRWWSVDPASEALAGMSPYQAMGNSPILNSDPEGDLFFAIPQISFSGGFSIGLEVGFGLPGVASISATGMLGSNSSWSVQGRAGGVYAGYGSGGAFAGVGYQWSGLSAGYDFVSGTASLGYGGGFGNGYAASIGLSYGKGGLGFNAAASSTYMWGTINPGTTAETNGGEQDNSGSTTKGNKGLYSDQTEAYNIMVNQTDATGVETAAWLTDDGVLISPYEYLGNKNNEDSSGNSYYKVTARGKNFYVYNEGAKLKIRGQVHTHPKEDLGPWYFHNGKMISGGDDQFVMAFRYHPVYTIGPSKVHLGIYSNRYIKSYLGLTRGLLNGRYGLY